MKRSVSCDKKNALEVFRLKHQNNLYCIFSGPGEGSLSVHHAVRLLYTGHVLAVCKHKEKSVRVLSPERTVDV